MRAMLSMDGKRRAFVEAFAKADVLERVAGAVAIHLYEMELRSDDSYECTAFVGVSLERLLGPLPPDKPPEEAWDDAVHPDDRAAYDHIYEILRQGRPTEIEYRLVGYDGKERWVWDRMQPHTAEDGRLLVHGIVLDITERKTMERSLLESESRKKAILDTALECVITIDHAGRILEFNPAAERTFGYPQEQVVGKPMAELIIPPRFREAHARAFRRYLDTGESSVLGRRVELSALRSDGTEFPIEIVIATVDLPGPPVFTAYLRDITERKAAEEALRWQALHDALTGLPNRRKLMEDLEEVFAAPVLDELGVAIFDLNGFKTYNDVFGHFAGDTMLTRLAQRLAAAVEGEATPYRIGGDEFCVVARSGAPEPIFERAQEALLAHGEWFSIEAAYGQVLIPMEATELSSALQIADGRLYAHKRASRSSAVQQTRDVLMQVMIEQDPGLRTHVSRVAELAEATAQRLGLTEDEVWYVRLAAELHDVGKAAMPESLLDKPGELDEAEWSFMKRHSVIGERIVSAAPALARVAGLVRATHERMDGDGYPDGLAGSDVPLGSRIVAVADAFDAMISTRPYAPARPVEEALAELERHAGTQFDADVVKAFIEVATTRPRAAEDNSEERAQAPIRLRAEEFKQQRLRLRLTRALARARARHWERPFRAATIARCVGERALALGDSALYGRSLVLEAQIAMRHGHLEQAFELVEEARAETKRSGDAELRVELAIAQSRLCFLAGLYRDALAQAEEAVALADRYELGEQRMAARRGLSLVLGNVEQSERLRSNAVELLQLTIDLGDRREEAMARNDLACSHLYAGELDSAHAEIERAIALCEELEAAGRFPLAYACSTRAELRIATGDPSGAVADCDAVLELAGAVDDPEPYLTAMTTHTKIEALIAQGDLGLALSTAHAELERLGDDVPHARSLILRTIATALREIGRTDEAFAAMQASAELDRVTFEQLTARQLDLQRAALEAQAARHEAQVLTAKNAQLEELVSELRRAQDAEAA